MILREVDFFNEEKVNAHLSRALDRLCERDEYLFVVNASERAICVRLAFYLQFEFPDFDVDCEYNRNHKEEDLKKKLPAGELEGDAGRGPKIDDDDSITVYPDIIVHRRGTPDNLLVIEAKKSKTTIRSNKYDEKKLKAYKKILGYRFAKFVGFGTQAGEALVYENRFVEPDTE